MKRKLLNMAQFCTIPAVCSLKYHRNVLGNMSQICHVCFFVTLCGKEGDFMGKHGIYWMHVLLLPEFYLLFCCVFVLVFNDILMSFYTRYIYLLLMFNCAETFWQCLLLADILLVTFQLRHKEDLQSLFLQLSFVMLLFFKALYCFSISHFFAGPAYSATESFSRLSNYRDRRKYPRFRN